MFAHLAASLHTLGFNLQSRLRSEERGATAVEYGIMVGILAVLLIVGITVFGKDLSTFFSDLTTDIGLQKTTTP